MNIATMSAVSARRWTGLGLTCLLMLAVAVVPKTARADSAETVAVVLVGAALLYAATDYDDRKHGRDRSGKHYRDDYRSSYSHYDTRAHYSSGYRGKDYRHDNGRRDWSDRGKGHDKHYWKHKDKHKGQKYDDRYVRDHRHRTDARFDTRVSVH